jgi:hypothetical protein
MVCLRACLGLALTALQVKNPGLIPSFDSMLKGDIKRKQNMVEEVRCCLDHRSAIAHIAQILAGCYKATFAPDDATQAPFAADVIISNPPAFAHVHCAEKLGCPLHLVFSAPAYLC